MWLTSHTEAMDAPLTAADFEQAIRKVQSSVGQGDVQKYQQWFAEFGAT